MEFVIGLISSSALVDQFLPLSSPLFLNIGLSSDKLYSHDVDIECSLLEIQHFQEMSAHLRISKKVWEVVFFAF